MVYEGRQAGRIASNYKCSKCNERMGLYERKSAVLDEFERRFRMGMFDHYLAEYLWRRSHGHSLSDEAFKAFFKICCHAVPCTQKRSAVRK
ncbi:hypothetical protein TNCV_1653741 [Trichonephila clavipes]|nr:hypothetical protein TNCV_1653741 [Trichonephila clavipes]